MDRDAVDPERIIRGLGERTALTRRVVQERMRRGTRRRLGPRRSETVGEWMGRVYGPLLPPSSPTARRCATAAWPMAGSGPARGSANGQRTSARSRTAPRASGTPRPSRRQLDIWQIPSIWRTKALGLPGLRAIGVVLHSVGIWWGSARQHGSGGPGQLPTRHFVLAGVARGGDASGRLELARGFRPVPAGHGAAPGAGLADGAGAARAVGARHPPRCVGPGCASGRGPGALRVCLSSAAWRVLAPLARAPYPPRPGGHPQAAAPRNPSAAGPARRLLTCWAVRAPPPLMGMRRGVRA